MENINSTLQKLSILSYGQNNDSIISKKSKYRKNKIVIFMLFIGQILSILFIFSLYIPTYYLPNSYFNFPILVKSLSFLIFGIIYFIIKHSIKYPKGYFFLVIFFESQGYYFRILAENDFKRRNQKATIVIFKYDYISIVLNFILVIFFSFPNLKTYQYSCWHFFSIFISLIGIVLISYTFYINTIHLFELNIKNIIYLVISCLSYSISFIFQEINFKKENNISLFFIYQGIFSGLILFIESFILKEPDRFSFEHFNYHSIILLSVFIIIQLLHYSILPFFIKSVTSIFLTMSLGNSIVYIYFIFKIKEFPSIKLKYLFFIIGGMILNFIGLFIFEKVKIKKMKDEEEENLIEKINSNNITILNNNDSLLDYGIELQKQNLSYIKIK